MSSDEPAEVSLDEGSPKDKMTERRKRIQEAIFEAAIEEFANKGFEGASTQSIAQRAGLTKPQLHYYIESKEELYKNILLTILEDWNQIFLGATAEDDPAITNWNIALKILNLRVCSPPKLQMGHLSLVSIGSHIKQQRKMLLNLFNNGSMMAEFCL